MNTRLVAIGGVLLVAVAAGTAALVTGFGPAPGDGGSDPAGTPVPTGTVYEGDAGGGSGDSGSVDSGPPFAFTIDRIEKCGRTCREVTATITNRQNETATGVTVYTRIYAGNTTESDDRVWSGTEEVGTLEAGASSTSTKRVELSLMEARKVQNNDGWITVVTTVESDETTITFKSRRDVA